MNRTITYSYTQLSTIIQQIMPVLAHCQVITLQGPLGAGKTTFTKAFLEQHGIDESTITSPTFTYVNMYSNAQGQRFYHFDLYRLSTLEEFISLGFNEYLYQPNSICLIEWPEPIVPLLTHSVCTIKLDYGQQENERIISVESSS